MSLSFRPLHPLFVAEAGPIDLRTATDRATLDEIRAGMDRHAVLVFRNQPFTDAQQMDFAQRFDGELHAKTGAAALGKSRLGTEAIAEPSGERKQATVLFADIVGSTESIAGMTAEEAMEWLRPIVAAETRLKVRMAATGSLFPSTG